MKRYEELYAEAKSKSEQAEKLKAESADLYRLGDVEKRKATTVADRLVYAAASRCPCGAGLAYDPLHVNEESPFVGPLSNAWDCSAILLGTADKTVKHTAKLPFAFYEVKSENQPSANGATTRPKETSAA